jgi:hypothetical protein
VHVGPFVQHYRLAFKTSDRADRGPFGEEQRLAFWIGRLITKINQRRIGSLSENRRRFTGIPHIDNPGVERFKQLRAGGKKQPFHLFALLAYVLSRSPCARTTFSVPYF